VASVAAACVPVRATRSPRPRAFHPRCGRCPRFPACICATVKVCGHHYLAADNARLRQRSRTGGDNIRLVPVANGQALTSLRQPQTDQIEKPERAGGEKGSRGGLATVTGLLLRKAQAVRAGAQGDDDYDVIGTDGVVIGRIFKATRSPAGTPWMWTLAYGDHEDRTPTHG
jgi:hypothetical protein